MNMNTASQNTQVALPFAPGYAPSALSGFCEHECRYDAPRLIRSVVSEAGLGRFVYLQGKSERRYVFSAITPEQASLYDNALFATVSPVDDSVQIFEKSIAPSGQSETLYVHLLSAAEGECLDETKDDLGLH